MLGVCILIACLNATLLRVKSNFIPQVYDWNQFLESYPLQPHIRSGLLELVAGSEASWFEGQGRRFGVVVPRTSGGDGWVEVKTFNFVWTCSKIHILPPQPVISRTWNTAILLEGGFFVVRIPSVQESLQNHQKVILAHYRAFHWVLFRSGRSVTWWYLLPPSALSSLGSNIDPSGASLLKVHL